jgi:hypothetical protein
MARYGSSYTVRPTSPRSHVFSEAIQRTAERSNGIGEAMAKKYPFPSYSSTCQ